MSWLENFGVFIHTSEFDRLAPPPPHPPKASRGARGCASLIVIVVNLHELAVQSGYRKRQGVLRPECSTLKNSRMRRASETRT